MATDAHPAPDFRVLFEGAPDLYLVLTPDLTIVAVSDAYCRATLTTREQLVGRHLFDAFPDNPGDATADGVTNLRASLSRVLAHARPDAMPVQKYDIPRPPEQGGGFEERYWSPLNTPILDAAGSVVLIIHRVEDVTERAGLERRERHALSLHRDQLRTIAELRAENRALSRNGNGNGHGIDWRASEQSVKGTDEFLNVIIENIPAMVFVKDAVDHRFLLVNRAGEELLGIGRAEMIGKNDYDFFPRDQADDFIARDRETLLSGRMLDTAEEPIQSRTKGARLIRTKKIPVADPAGRPQYLVALVEDITERKRIDQALQESEARFRGLLAASPDAVVVTDREGVIQLASHRVEALFGYAAGELTGRSFGSLFPEGERAAHLARLTGLASGSHAVDRGEHRDLHALRKDGSEFAAEVGLSATRSGSDEVVIAAIRDITDRIAVETQLRQAQKMEAIGNLTGGMAHDFNNLLGIIIGNLDLLIERNGPARPPGEDLAQEALDAALRGAELTQRLLAFARRQPLQPQEIDLNAHIARFVRLLSRTFPEDVEIALDQGIGVWSVRADPTQLDASLLNIVNNAGDAMPRGGVLSLTTTNRSLDEEYAVLHPGLSPGDYAMIEISDSGTGMSADVVSHIFEPFFTTKEQGKGTGLGLSMAFGFIKQSGGHITVYSEPGVGTTFRLYLPRSASAGSNGDIEPVTNIERGGSETILAVEDNAALRKVVARQLRELGYRLIEAEDGPSALRLLEANRVDLLLTDVVMPGGISGYDLARTVLARWPGTKVLLTSGFPDVRLNGDGNVPATMRLLVKPYRKADLARILREVLDG